MPWFRLIGRPLCPTDLIDLVRYEDLDSNPDLQWHSIDYKASTDGLSWKLSCQILDRVTASLPKRVRNLAFRVLGPHGLHYPEPGPRRKTKFWGDQRNGQLMGSILSFPILCLANLGLCLRVKEGSTPNAFLINGDDALYLGTSKEWEDHVRLGKEVGLEMSVGKAYRHREYANLNSTCFHMPIKPVTYFGNEVVTKAPTVTPCQIDFLNTGLIFGQHKVLSNVAEAHMRDDPSATLSSNLPRILEGALPGRQASLLGGILRDRGHELHDDLRVVVKRYVNGKLLSKVTTSRNLFLPRSVGGAGVLAPPGFTYRITHTDRLIAQAVMCGYTYWERAGISWPLSVPADLRVAWAKVSSGGDVQTFSVDGVTTL